VSSAFDSSKSVSSLLFSELTSRSKEIQFLQSRGWFLRAAAGGRVTRRSDVCSISAGSSCFILRHVTLVEYNFFFFVVILPAARSNTTYDLDSFGHGVYLLSMSARSVMWKVLFFWRIRRGGVGVIHIHIHIHILYRRSRNGMIAHTLFNQKHGRIFIAVPQFKARQKALQVL
jgi:hypothetical protein